MTVAASTRGRTRAELGWTWEGADVASVERLPDPGKGTPWRARVRLPGGKVQSRTFYSEKEARNWAATLEGD